MHARLSPIPDPIPVPYKCALFGSLLLFIFQVWSGLKRGPPRKEKFPEPENLLEQIEKEINKK